MSRRRTKRDTVAPGSQLEVSGQTGLATKDRQASPAKLPTGTASAAYTWDGRVTVQNPRVYRHWAKTSEWVRGAITIRRSQVSSADWDIVPFDQRQRWSKRLAADIKAQFQTPNPSNDSWRTFVEPVIEDLLTLDAGCIEKVRSLDGKIRELWPVDGAQVKVNALWDGSPKAARYFWYPDGFKEQARWKNEDFIYMMMNPRTDTPIGLPPLETLRATVEAEMAAHEYNRRQVENAAPDGIINLGEGFTEVQVNRFREFFESEVAGRGPLGFIGGSKDPGFIKFRDSNRDQQFLEWQIYLVRKIAVVFGLTPQDLGVTFDINRSTSEVQLQVSEDRGLRPLMSLIQEYLTEEIVWDQSFGGQNNNLAFRFTALNLKESTAKANIYKQALAGVPWRFINEARIDEGREPIPEMEGKLIMATPQGAVDISDVPTVREMLEMQQAAKAAPASKGVEDMVALMAPLMAAQIAAQQQKPNVDLNAVTDGVMGIIREHFSQDRQVAAAQSESLLKIAEAIVTRPIQVDAPVTISEGAVQVEVANPPITVEGVEVNLSAPPVIIEEGAVKVGLPEPDVDPEPEEPTRVRKIARRNGDGQITEVLEETVSLSGLVLKRTRKIVTRDADGRIAEVIEE